MKWSNPNPKCDFRNTDGGGCNITPWFVDGKTRSGPWALMCSNHYTLHGVGLGTGKGQRYDAVTLEKLEG